MKKISKVSILGIIVILLCILTACHISEPTTADLEQEEIQSGQEAAEPEQEEMQSGLEAAEPEQEAIQSAQDAAEPGQGIVQSGQDMAELGQGEQKEAGSEQETMQSDGLEGQILEQSFTIELDGFGKVIFAPFEPVSYPSENPDYGTTMFGDVRFMLLSSAGGEKVYDFPGETEDNILVGFTQFHEVLSVTFNDYNEDGRMDIILLLEYLNSEGKPFRRPRVYTQMDVGREFSIDRELSEFLLDYTESVVKMDGGIAIYKYREIDDAYYLGNLTEEELIELLNEKYYMKSAYYSDITDYWENVREVRDISNHILPLYGTDRRYFTKENLAFDPPVVIHLAKNEIYARHGYIFKDPDLYNYFMGCIWYRPTTAPEDFSDEVFNEYEKENLKLLSELDVLP